MEEIGVTPDYSYREKKTSLKTVGLAVVASIRMKNLAKQWAGNKRLHEVLMKKLEGVKSQRRQASGKHGKVV